MDGFCFEFRPIGVDGCDAGSQDICNLLIVGDVQSDQGKDAQFCCEMFGCAPP